MAVYFILDKRYNVIKIGYSKNVTDRLEQIASTYKANIEDMELIGTIECQDIFNERIEGEMHKRFSHLCLTVHPLFEHHTREGYKRQQYPKRREWFSFSSEFREVFDSWDKLGTAVINSEITVSIRRNEMISKVYELAEDVVKAVDLWMVADIDDEELMSDGFQQTLREMQIRRHNALCDMADEYNAWTDGFQRMQPVGNMLEGGGRDDEYYTSLDIIDKSALKPYRRIEVEK